MSRNPILALVLLSLSAMPALAEDVQYEGHTLQVDANLEDRPIQRMTGTLYTIGAPKDWILGKAQTCAGDVPGLANVAVDAEGGRLVADGRFAYRKGWSDHVVKSRFTLEASEGHFQVVQSDLGYASEDAVLSGNYQPILQEDGAWDNRIDVAIEREQAFIDCMFR